MVVPVALTPRVAPEVGVPPTVTVTVVVELGVELVERELEELGEVVGVGEFEGVCEGERVSRGDWEAVDVTETVELPAP